jgi:hypothetical protein
LNRPAPSAATGTALEASQAGTLVAWSMAFPTKPFSLQKAHAWQSPQKTACA